MKGRPAQELPKPFEKRKRLTPRRFLLRMNDLNGKKKIFDLETGQVEDANPETPLV